MTELREKCGIFGIFGEGLDVSRLAFYGLFALQHRGQESSGIAVANGAKVRCFKNSGLVTHAYSEEDVKKLTGFAAIGHNRYSTSQGTGLRHAQPFVLSVPAANPSKLDTKNWEGDLALAHNGNLPSTLALEEFLSAHGVDPKNQSDSRLMTMAVAYYMEQGQDLATAVQSAYPLFTGAFSLVLLTKDALVAVRDQYGIRPLAIGKLNGGHVFASETCAFNTIGAKFEREVQPGEMVVVTKGGMRSIQLAPPIPRLDIFEFVYFARPDSELLGRSVYEVRRECGRRLAKENKISADMVVPVPETAVPVATGYAEQSGIPFEMALIKNRYIHRTFIQPDQHSRDLGVRLKLTPLPGVLRGKRVVLIDDSIVRGTTSRQLVKAIFEAGASEVHFVVSSPPVKFPDFYGIDTPKQETLIAAKKTNEEIREYLGATSLHYLSLDGLLESIGVPPEELNTSCFTGEYPIDLGERALEVRAPLVPPERPAARLF